MSGLFQNMGIVDEEKDSFNNLECVIFTLSRGVTNKFLRERLAEIKAYEENVYSTLKHLDDNSEGLEESSAEAIKQEITRFKELARECQIIYNAVTKDGSLGSTNEDIEERVEIISKLKRQAPYLDIIVERLEKHLESYNQKS